MNYQLETATRIFNMLTDLGYKCELDTESCRYDIRVELGTVETNNLTIGRVGVFWNSKGINHIIGYLGCGDNHSDCYEVYRKWIEPIQVEDIVNLIEKDIKELAIYHNKYIKFNKK